jgi:hypothetical protein
MVDETKSTLRIHKIERENRLLKGIIAVHVILSLAFATFVFLERARTKNSLEAKEILLKDQSGRVAARLGSNSIGTCLEILGKTKRAAAAICVGDESGSDLLLTTDHGDSRAFLSAGGKMYESAGENVQPSLTIARNGEGLITATMGAGGDSTPAQQSAESTASISVSQTKPAISLVDKNGKILWIVPQRDH